MSRPRWPTAPAWWALLAIVLVLAVIEAVGGTDGSYRTIGAEELRYPNAAFRNKVARYREKTCQMFYRGMSHYMAAAYPRDQLAPLTCRGVDTWGGFRLTLVDALDMFAALNDTKGLERAIAAVAQIDFKRGAKAVSVFETNIRVLGSLLSAHILAKTRIRGYAGRLLDQARQLGDELLRAFDSPTGLPYAELRFGRGPVKRLRGYNEVCCAAASTFLLEFAWLSRLTGDGKYEEAAREALRQVWQMRSKRGLVAEVANVDVGGWETRVATLGANVDSFYEYTAKHHAAFGDERETGDIFLASYAAAMRHLVHDGWPLQADIKRGRLDSPLAVHALAAFLPGVQVLAGDRVAAFSTLSRVLLLLNRVPFLPEVALIDPRLGIVPQVRYHIQRPEALEALWWWHQASGDWRAQAWAMEYVDRIEELLTTRCGYASLDDVVTMRKSDNMESFLLAETFKYLYLILTPQHEFAGVDVVLTTEAHPLPVAQRARVPVRGRRATDAWNAWRWRTRKSKPQCLAELAASRRASSGNATGAAGSVRRPSRRLCPPDNEYDYPAPPYRLSRDALSARDPSERMLLVSHQRQQCLVVSGWDAVRVSTLPLPAKFINRVY